MTLTESGVLVKASAEVTNDTIDIVTGTIKTGAGLIAQALPILLSEAAGDELDEEQQKCRLLSVEKWVEELELERAGILGTDTNGPPTSIDETKLAAEKRIPDMLRNKAKFKSGYAEAKRIVEQIKDFSDRRTSILAEQPSSTAQVATVNADSIRVVLEELAKTIKELKQNYFFGSESTITWNASFRLNPSSGKMAIDLFTLSKEHGVCNVLVNQGTRLDPKFRIKKRCKGGAATCKPSQMEDVQCVGLNPTVLSRTAK